MVSDSLTYVYSSHEWQQARATTSFGRDYRNAASGHKDTSQRGENFRVSVRGDSSGSGHAARSLLSFIAVPCCSCNRPRSETATSLCKPLAGCTALQT